MSAYGRPPRRTKDLKVDPANCPGWVSGTERMPAKGERVQTNEGTGVVVRIFGKTTDGGRLIELSMDDGRKPPFFAAVANIMVQPVAGVAAPVGGLD